MRIMLRKYSDQIEEIDFYVSTVNGSITESDFYTFAVTIRT